MKAAIEKYRGLPLVSGSLVLINIIVYAICIITEGRLYTVGRVSVLDAVLNREYGRILWSVFLHSDTNHIFNNMLLVFFLGGMIEKEVGHIPYAACYLLSGMGGNILSLGYKVMTKDWSASIGASGAVFGLTGVLLAMVLLSGRKMPTVTPVRVGIMILLSLYNGFSSSNVDNAAHIGGLLTGFAFGIVVCIIQKSIG